MQEIETYVNKTALVCQLLLVTQVDANNNRFNVVEQRGNVVFASGATTRDTSGLNGLYGGQLW